MPRKTMTSPPTNREEETERRQAAGQNGWMRIEDRDGDDPRKPAILGFAELSSSDHVLYCSLSKHESSFPQQTPLETESVCMIRVDVTWIHKRPRTETDPYRRRIRMKEASSNASAPWLEQKKADHSIVPDQVPVHITVADRAADPRSDSPDHEGSQEGAIPSSRYHQAGLTAQRQQQELDLSSKGRVLTINGPEMLGAVWAQQNQPAKEQPAITMETSGLCNISRGTTEKPSICGSEPSESEAAEEMGKHPSLRVSEQKKRGAEHCDSSDALTDGSTDDPTS
ncbi:hypothetical protein CRENBAI_012921 [Crenichthys baileyi]|uniref:Uncharacterized protein n=1 Tax=Crenichthys baileyi TaxID=28760 RepID=A0AAV9RFF8_9TELE